ncbi:(2Fe-2S)-binding protein [Vibrio hippocampi]|uniref:Bacterioferritin-associated ferredoxin n=1 Tax=Vibrio hippocampi TaxID=654686 RepID=A0ABN8DFC1_9VIBR|nr:(2Fe-2S)-binding protein [Vibrio hippocampi]CAH0524490.1 Bacterioferritin-associated ferredoxin [Vibrio hippocampi]
MFVCLCHGVSDKKLRKLVIEDGISDMRTIRKCTSLGSQCGKCIKQAKEILDETQSVMFAKVS